MNAYLYTSGSDKATAQNQNEMKLEVGTFSKTWKVNRIIDFGYSQPHRKVCLIKLPFRKYIMIVFNNKGV